MDKKKITVLLEILVVFLAFSVIFRLIAFWVKDMKLNYMLANSIYIIWAAAIPLLLIWITKTNVGFNKWRIAAYGGFIVFWLGFIQSAGFASVGALKLQMSSLPALFILIGVVCIMIALAIIFLSKIDETKKYKVKWKLIFFAFLFLIPPIVAIIGKKPMGKMLFYEFYFTVGIGFAEEVMYRGYIQTRLNNYFGRPWQIGKIQFGPGLIITSLLFGIAHAYMLGSMESQWLFAFAACFAGLFFGIVREKAGLWAAISFHVLWSAIPEPIMIIYGLM